MHRVSPQPTGFALIATAIFAVGLFSALIDGTLGWEYLVQELLDRLSHLGPHRPPFPFHNVTG